MWLKQFGNLYSFDNSNVATDSKSPNQNPCHHSLRANLIYLLALNVLRNLLVRQLSPRAAFNQDFCDSDPGIYMELDNIEAFQHKRWQR